MKSTIAVLGLAWFVLSACTTNHPVAAAPQAVSLEEDTASINAVITRLEAAWAAGDGEAWGKEFTENADFTVWFGLRISGREPIAQGHQGIFDGIYKDTWIDMDVASIRLITADVALVQVDGWVTDDGKARAETDAEVHPLIVMARSGDGWIIEDFQNTPNYGPMRVVNGDIRAQPEFAGK